MCERLINTFILESRWGNSVFEAVRPVTIFEVDRMLRDFGFNHDSITEVGGEARTFHDGTFLDIFDLETKIMGDPKFIKGESSMHDEPEDFCPVLARFASFSNRSLNG